LESTKFFPKKFYFFGVTVKKVKGTLSLGKGLKGYVTVRVTP